MSKLTVKKKEEFFGILAEGSSVTSAAKAIGISRQSLYKMRLTDSEFAQEWDDAIESGTDVLEDEAVKRAKDSSDTLLIFLLKGRRPDKYKDKNETQLNVKGQVDFTQTRVIKPKVEDDGKEPADV